MALGTGALAAAVALTIGSATGAAGICTPAVEDFSVPGAVDIRAVATGPGGYLYTSGGDIGLRSIDTGTSTLSPDFADARPFSQIVVNHTTNRIYAFWASPRDTMAVVADGSAQSTITTLAPPIGKSTRRPYAVVDEGANRLYAANIPTGRIAVIDGVTSTVVDTFDMAALVPGNGQRFVTGLAVDSAAHLLYVATDTSFNPNLFAVAVIDVSSSPAALVTTISLPAEGNGLALDQAAGRLYAVVRSLAGVSTLVEIDTSTRTITRQLTLSQPAEGLNPLLDPTENRLFVLSASSAPAITEIDLGTLAETASILAPPQSRDIALDAPAHKLYVAWTDPSTDPTVGKFSTFDVSCGLTPPDDDADGVPDDIDSDAGTGTSPPGFIDPTGNGKTTFGQLTSGTATVSDVADPKGVRITATSNAVLAVCGPPPFELELPAGMSVTITCASVLVENVEGSGEAVVRTPNGSVSVTFDQGDIGEVSDDGVVTVTSGTLTVVVDGVHTNVGPGAPKRFNGWDFNGFAAPIDNSPSPTIIVLNELKAGQTVPLKWHLAETQGGIPVTTLSSASVSVQAVACGEAASTDPIEEVAPGPSGLINKGGGDYQLNWRTDKLWKGTCKVMHLKLGNDAVAHDAYFKFK